MPKERIQTDDTLNSGRKKINKAIDRAYDADGKSSQAVNASNEAIRISTDARRISIDANEKSEYTQTQLDTVTGEGTIDPSVEQLKVGSDGQTYPSPDARIRAEHEEVSAQLDKTEKDKALKLIAKNVVYSEVGEGFEYHDITETGRIYATRWYTVASVSEDGGKTYSNLNFPSRGVITLIKELTNGRVMIATKGPENVGEVYVSNDAKTEFTKVVTNSPNSYTNGWTFSEHENVIALSEYGVQGKAQKAYLSTDYGTTFKTIFDLGTVATVPTNAHVHGIIYDKYWERLWIIQGDGSVINGNVKIFYSDNLGVTWDSFTPQAQMLTAWAFPDRVMFTTDAAPNGIFVYERGKKEGTPHLTLAHLYEDMGVPGVSYLPSGLIKRSDSDPLLIPLQNGDSPAEVRDKPNMILGTYDGLNMFEIWKDTKNHKRGGKTSAVGPTNDGKILSANSDDNRFTDGWTKVEADLEVVKTNAIKGVTNQSDVITTEEMGITGDTVGQNNFLGSLQTASRLGKTLYVPPHQTILVERNFIRDLDGVKLNCEGTIKIIDLGSGGYAEALYFENAKNIKIAALNIDTNRNNTSSTRPAQGLHIALGIKNSENVEIGKVVIKNLAGEGIDIEGSKNVSIGSAVVRGNDTGRRAVRIINSENILFGRLKIYDVGISAGNSNVIDIRSSNGVTRNVTINDLYLENISTGTIAVEKESGTLENIEINGEVYKKEGSDGWFNNVTLNGINGLRLDMKFSTSHEDMSVKPLSDVNAFNLVDIDNFTLKLEVRNVYQAVRLGKVKNGIITGKVENTYSYGVLLGDLENVDFDKLETNKLNESDLAVANFQSSGATPMKNVTFKDSRFKKGKTTRHCFDLFSKTFTNVLFEGNDFSEWAHNKQLSHENSGVKRFNNLGMNWSSGRPDYYDVYWQKGDLIYNTNPTAGGWTGWVCVEAGRPGTWKGFGQIES